MHDLLIIRLSDYFDDDAFTSGEIREMIECLCISHGSSPPLFDIIDHFSFCALNVVHLVLVRLLVGYSFVVLVINNTLTLIT